jgi:ubiquinone/menaquinone biosynthesis C-methylase UbiE
MTRFEKRFVNSARHSARVAKRAEQLVRLADPQPGQRLLDVGCGNGAAALHLSAALGLDVTGVDVDPEQIRDAAAASEGSVHVRFSTADATALPFANGEFDLVFTSKTTHHVPDWQRAVGEMVRVLGAGGRLVYTDFVAPFGRRFPTRRALDRIAAERGLRVVHRSGSRLHPTVVVVFRKQT